MIKLYLPGHRAVYVWKMLLISELKFRCFRRSCSPSRTSSSTRNPFGRQNLPKSRPFFAPGCWRRRVPLFFFQMPWKRLQSWLCFTSPMLGNSAINFCGIAEEFRSLHRRITPEILWIVSFMNPYYLVVFWSYLRVWFVAIKKSSQWVCSHNSSIIQARVATSCC